MPHMQFATWIREHRQDIAMFALYSVCNFKNFAIVPVLLNLRLNGTCLIFGVNVRSRHRDMRYNKKVKLRLLHSIAQNQVKCQFLAVFLLDISEENVLDTLRKLLSYRSASASAICIF